MDAGIFVRGVAIGLAIAAPVGPIGVLCIRRTLAEGRLAGLVTGLGAATADTVYGAVAAFGLTAISAFLVSQQDMLRLIGGAFLLYLGVRTFLARPVEQAAVAGDRSSRTLAGDYGTTFLLTITNPLTILSFAAVFAGLGLGSGYDDLGSALLLVAGVFSGSALWWLLLSGAVSLLRRRITVNALRWVNRVSGLIIVLFGIAALASLLG
ncbi:MAG: LysE family translocator [Caldilineales bacterium]